jgi:immune inhibitor A
MSRTDLGDASVERSWTVDQRRRTCAVPPSPELRRRWQDQLDQAQSAVGDAAPPLRIAGEPRRLGFNDGVIIPPETFPEGTPLPRIREAAADRAPLRGTVRIAVVLVDFSDHQIGQGTAHFEELFFSSGVLPHGSVKEYYSEVTGGLVSLDGVVVGTYRMPQTLAWYANNGSGIGKNGTEFRSPQMALDAVTAADPDIDFSSYDNDGNGYVDAFIVVHAGSGAETSGSLGDIWSHKSTLSSAYQSDGKQVFGYLTIPEDSRIGVCAHELGHLLFGFPDLYDTDYSSEGIGQWCLMAGGTWNGLGDVPAHPSAWCKANQGWATVTNVTRNGPITITAVETSRTVYRLWTRGASGPEYFLAEHRQRVGYDQDLPGEGLLVWHIDENQPGNTDENHYKVGLLQADGRRDLEQNRNDGDAGDPYPGSAGATSLTNTTTPSTAAYTGTDTSVSLTSITTAGASTQVNASVSKKMVWKDLKDVRKDTKELLKDITKDKEIAKDQKDNIIDHGWPHGSGSRAATPGQPDAETRLSLLESVVFGGSAQGTADDASAASPFIGADLRPDLLGATTQPSSQELEQRMAAGDAGAKREFDTAAR